MITGWSGIGRAAEPASETADPTAAVASDADESGALDVDEAGYMQPGPPVPPVPAGRPLLPVAPRIEEMPGWTSFGGLSRSALSSDRAERAAGPSNDVVFGAESALRVSTDTGSLLGKSSGNLGLGVQRRTPIVTDPRIRGLGTAQQLASGSYWFPARQDLDTSLSKIDSHLVQDAIIIKGPYSALYGPGLAFYDVELVGTPRYEDGRQVHGTTGLDFQTNGQQFYGRQDVWGGAEDWGFRIAYGHRTGNDYLTGDGTAMPASYNSRDFFLALGRDLSPDTHLEFSYLRLDQTGVEFPAQIFDMEVLVTDGFELRYVAENQCYFDRLEMDGWYNETRFVGNSQGAGKRRQIPALDDPFLLNGFLGFTNADAMSAGFRLATTWGCPNDPNFTAGVDLRCLSQQLDEYDLSPALGTSYADHNFNFPIPRSHITNPGLFAQAVLPVDDQLTLRSGARLDWISSTAATSVANTDLNGDGMVDDLESSLGGGFDRDYTLGSAFVTGEYQLAEHWTGVGGFGFAMRPPTLTELYACLPSLALLQQGFTKVAGNPGIHPERLWQVDLGVQGVYDRFRVGVRGFHSWVFDYITYETLGNLAGFSDVLAVRFINTDQATLDGGEANVAYDCNDWLTSFGIVSYVEGRDRTRGVRGAFDYPPFFTFSPQEPLPGIVPLESRFGVRLHDPGENPRWGAEVSCRLVADQNRVASSLNEKPTSGFTTFDMRGYWQATDGFLLIAGVENLSNLQYREHLDVRTGLGMYQPGRSFYFGSELRY
jgi:iron complex outermembrane recepter protein